MSFPLLISSTAAADITPLFYATVSGILKPDTGFKQHRRSSIRTATVSGEREREKEKPSDHQSQRKKKSAAIASSGDWWSHGNLRRVKLFKGLYE